jgi:hypothetical protein
MLTTSDFVYTGLFQHGKFHGKGKMVYSSGNVYDGNLSTLLSLLALSSPLSPLLSSSPLLSPLLPSPPNLSPPLSSSPLLSFPKPPYLPLKKKRNV